MESYPVCPTASMALVPLPNHRENVLLLNYKKNENQRTKETEEWVNIYVVIVQWRPEDVVCFDFSYGAIIHTDSTIYAVLHLYNR